MASQEHYGNIRPPVIARCRFLLHAGWALSTTLAVARGQALVVGSQSPPSPTVAVAALPAPPDWSATASVNAGFGYKDNLLLSQVGEEGSGFARGGFETFLWHVPHGRIDYFAVLNAAGTR